MTDILDIGDVRIEWVELGEGYDGDYCVDDPNDIELLRFDVSQRNEAGGWSPVEDGSYCTLMPASATHDQRRRGLELLHWALGAPGDGFRRRAEEMSWMSLESLTA